MALSKNQKIIGGAAILAAILLFLNRKKLPLIGTKTPDAVTENVSETNVVADVKTVATPPAYQTKSYAEGNICNDELVKEVYKEIVSMGAYLMSSKDKLATDVMSRINTQAFTMGRPPQMQTLEYIKGTKKGQVGLKGALKLINNELDKHAEYFLTKGKFLVE